MPHVSGQFERNGQAGNFHINENGDIGMKYEDGASKEEFKSAGHLSPLKRFGFRSRSSSQSPQPTNAKYVYEPLWSESYMRVVRILPGSKRQRLECQLIAVPLEGSPLTYEAVSYTWGELGQSSSIICEGRDIPITKALSAVIRHLRHAESPRDLWIDQLCINQEDIAERSKQVQVMADIYRAASQVIVWLGEKSKHVDLAFKFAEQMSHISKTLGGNFKQFGEVQLQQYGLPRAGDKAWAALGALLQRPWFSRAWVIQEVAMSTSAVVQCGNLSIAWADFAQAVSHLTSGASRRFGASLYHNGSPAERVGLTEGWRKWRHRAKADPFKVFTFTKNCDATDPRDHLFAFTSMANLKVETDYSCPAEDIYVAFASNFIKRALKGDQSTFSRQEGRQDPRTVVSGFLCNAGKLLQNLDLPSWVPDWSQRQHTRPLWTAKNCGSLQLVYDAGGNTMGECDLDGNKLRVSAMLVDAITCAGKTDLTNTVDWPGKQLQQRCLDWFKEASVMHFSSLAPYLTGEPRNEALMRTLIADLDFDNGRVHILFAHYCFNHFLNYIYQRTQRVLFSSAKTDMMKEWSLLPVAGTILGRVFFVTQQGYIGLAPYGVQPGDEVAIMLGCDIPLVLRRQGYGLNGPEFHLLGECYVHGIMFGEAMQEQSIPVTSIVLR